MHAPRIAYLVLALVLTAACDQSTEPLMPNEPAFRVTVSVTPDTAHPQDSVLVRTIVRNVADISHSAGGTVTLCSLTLAEEQHPCHWYGLPWTLIAESQADTVETWWPLTGWPAPDSVRVKASVSWTYICDLQGTACHEFHSAADTLVVAP
jgi:hypothetical protein